MISLEGWGNPGRVVNEVIHKQMFGIINYLNDKKRIGDDVWAPPLQEKIGATIDVNQASTVRHIIGFMKSIGVLYEDSLEGRRVPNPDHCVTPSGEVLYSIIKMEQLALESEDKSLLEGINNFYKRFYANAFIYWFVRDTKIHVARTVLKALKKYESLDKIEWFIINTFVTETDNEKEERMVDQYIHDYRSGSITLTTENIKKNVNSFNYWTQILSYSSLIKKGSKKITLGNQFPEFIEAILADDFLENLNVNDKYYLEG